MKYKAYKYRLYPTPQQKLLIAKHFGCCRWVYNYALNKKITAYQTNKQTLSRYDISADLPILKKQQETCWLKEVNSLSLQAALINLDSAYQKFFKGGGFPKFKSKKDNRQSFTIPQNTVVNFDTNRVSIPKFKEGIKARLHRSFKGTVKSSTITRTPSNKYFISILVEVDKPDTPKKPISESKAVGIDLGVKTFAVLSDGTKIPNYKFLRKSIDRLKRAQRLYSKKTKGSNNRWKSRVRLARMHEHVANQRGDFINKVVHFLVTHYGTICLETLNVKGMVKNHHLAQSIEDVSFGMFNELLEQKADEYGVNILRIGRFEPSSRMCTCGYVNHELTLSDREWTCPKCGAHHDRDLLAANNIKRFAFRNIHTAGTAGINACGDMITSLDGSAQEAPSL